MLFAIGYEGGGDDVAELRFDDGDTERLDAGDGAFLELELNDESVQRIAPDAPAGLLTAFTLGYKSSTLDAYNGDVDFSRFSLGLHEHLRFGERFRAGVGLIWEPDVELDTDLRGVTGGNADFHDAFGMRLSGEWRIGGRIALGLRATLIEYEFNGGPDDGDRLDGNSVGFSVGVALR